MYELFTRRPLFPNGEEDVRSLCEQRKGKEKLFNFFSKEIPETIQQRLFEILVESPEKRPRMEEILVSVRLTISNSNLIEYHSRNDLHS